MTQKEEIIDALKKCPKRGMSDREMMIKLFINRPSARMSELRKDGYRFSVKLKKIRNRKGKEQTIYQYTLLSEPEV